MEDVIASSVILWNLDCISILRQPTVLLMPLLVSTGTHKNRIVGSGCDQAQEHGFQGKLPCQQALASQRAPQTASNLFNSSTPPMFHLI